MRRLVFVTLLWTMTSPAVAAPVPRPSPRGEPVIPPGQEELLGNILGRGAALPGGCAFTGGQIEHATVVGRYQCDGGGVTIELSHPSRAPAGSLQTDRFAVIERGGTPPPGFSDALASWIRSHEAAFEWKWLLPVPTRLPEPSSPSGAPLPAPSWLGSLEQHASALIGLVAGLLALAALWRLRPRLARWLRTRQVRWNPVLRDKWFWAGAAVLAGSTVLRCWLGVINHQQNDNHLEVADLIRYSGWVQPESSACFECSHPKLYHYVLAFLLDRFPSQHMMVGNLLNVAAVTALLVLFLVFSRGGRWSPPVSILGFAFLSFNPALVGISSQATNDPFVILFSSLAIFFLGRFLAALSWKDIVVATGCMVLAALSKASGWVIFACGVGVLTLTALVDAERRTRRAVATAVLVLGFLCIVPLVNPYRENIVDAGTPFVNDAFEVPQMKQEVARPSVRWVFDDFFTFRFFELLRFPFNEYGYPPYPLHRESLWSQIYGRMFFLRFDQTIWQNQDPRLLDLGRLCLLLGLLPLTALMVGIVVLLRSMWHGISRRGLRWLAEHPDWHHLVYIAAMLAALIAVVVEYHRLAILITWMKALYLLPVILPFYKLFLDGLELQWRRWPRAVSVWMILLVAASIVDTGWLIHDLSGGPPN